MTNPLRTLAALLVALALLGIPVTGGTGGEPGLVNLPGSSGGQSKNASAPPRLHVVLPASEDLRMRVHPSMMGAIVLVHRPTPGAYRRAVGDPREVVSCASAGRKTSRTQRDGASRLRAPPPPPLHTARPERR